MAFKRLHSSLVILFGILSFGTLGYTTVEKMPFFDALYMTIITISTVGFSEIQPLSFHGRILTMVVIIASISVGAYSLGILVRIFIEGELRKSFERRRVEQQIKNLKDHFIICGYGRIGRIICRELLDDNVDFVVIEQEDSAVATLEKQAICLFRWMPPPRRP